MTQPEISLLTAQLVPGCHTQLAPERGILGESEPKCLVRWVVRIFQRFPGKNGCGDVFRHSNSKGKFKWGKACPSGGWQVLGECSSSFQFSTKALPSQRSNLTPSAEGLSNNGPHEALEYQHL
jgi:hypothetical protein